jgi:hypothetical protein
MLDLFHIPSNTDSTKIFYATGGINDWQTWEKPRNAKFIQIFCLGGGASGGSGVRGTNGSTRAGAGGGGSGGIAKALYPAFLLPDTLYVQVGAGGAFLQGTATGTTGNAGGISYVSIAPTTTGVSVLAQSSTAAALGGASIAASTTNAGGAAATIWTTGSAPFTSLGVLNLVAGVAGGISTNASTTAIVNVQALGSNIITGGGGGGGNNQITAGSYSATAGASILSASAVLVSTVNGGLTGSLIGVGNPGGSGYGSLTTLCGTGGAGGSGQASGSFSGGDGGNGWYGCGGGGGGAATITTGIGGSGGKGGDGLVIITTIF